MDWLELGTRDAILVLRVGDRNPRPWPSSAAFQEHCQEAALEVEAADRKLHSSEPLELGYWRSGLLVL